MKLRSLMQLLFCHFIENVLCIDFLVLVQEQGVDQADLIAFLLELSFHTTGEVCSVDL